jgi:hypothetical protein
LSQFVSLGFLAAATRAEQTFALQLLLADDIDSSLSRELNPAAFVLWVGRGETPGSVLFHVTVSIS